jgi:sortase A
MPCRADRPHARRPVAPWQFTTAVTLGTIALLAVWFVVYALGLSGLQEHHNQRVLFSHLRQELALATAPIGGAIKPGVPVALLNIPALHLHNVVVVEGTASGQLELGPGHLPNTPLPGQAGYSEILGRSRTFGAPFGSLSHLKPGSTFSVTTGQGVFGYKVVDVRAPGDPIPPASDFSTSGLTFVTSQTGSWTSGWHAGNVLYVDANLAQGKIQPTPAGRPATVATADQPFHGDDSDLIRIVLWLQVMVALVAVTAWAWLRWTRPQLWLVTVPAALAVLWATTSAVFPLLPNLS